MKRLFFFLLVFISSVAHSLAQVEVDYTSYYRKGVRWVSGVHDVGNVINKYEYYEIKGDSVLDGNLYTKLYWYDKLIGLLRDDEGTVYFRVLQSGYDLPEELGILNFGLLHTDYLLCSYTNDWAVDSCIVHTSWHNIMSSLVQDTIREELLDTVRLDNGKYHKRYVSKKYTMVDGTFYDELVYGFGHYRKGPLGTLIFEAKLRELGYCLLELYDGDELVFRATKYRYDPEIVNSILTSVPAVEAARDIQVFYSSVEKVLRIGGALPAGSFTVELVGTDGSKVLSFSGESCTLSRVPPGIYLVRIREGDSYIHTSKLRIE